MSTKLCPRCEDTLSTNKFNRNRSRKDGLQAYCKSCQNKYNNETYHKSSTWREQILQAKKNSRRRAQEFMWTILINSSCADCGISNPLVLEFDHKDPTTKKDNVSTMVARGLGVSSISAEIDKCEVVCANCHRIRTSKQQRWNLVEFIRALS